MAAVTKFSQLVFAYVVHLFVSVSLHVHLYICLLSIGKLADSVTSKEARAVRRVLEIKGNLIEPIKNFMQSFP